jgi:large subunit ribosomal protein L7Ae
MAQLVELARSNFNDNVDAARFWGGGIMGLKTQRRLERRARLIREEAAKKAMAM